MGNLLPVGRRKELSPEEKQRLLQEKYGVLIPPTFTAAGGSEYIGGGNGNPSSSTMLPLCTQAQFQILASPNVIDQLWNANTGRSLLTEYMQPGLYLKVPTSTVSEGGDGHVLVALEAATPSSASTDGTAVDNKSPKTTTATTAFSTRLVPKGAPTVPTKKSVFPPSPSPLPISPSPLSPLSTPVSTPNASPLSSSSFLSIAQSFPSNWDVQLLVPTSHRTSPTIQITSRGSLFPHTTVSARFSHAWLFPPPGGSSGGSDHDGATVGASRSYVEQAAQRRRDGWVSATVRLPLPNTVGIQCVVGSYMTMESIGNLTAKATAAAAEAEAAAVESAAVGAPVSASYRHRSHNHNHRYAPSTVHLQVAAEHHESVLAAHMEVPIMTPNTGGPFVPEQTDALLWLNLNSTAGGGGTGTNKVQQMGGGDNVSSSSLSQPTSSTSPPPPPLWLTLRRSYVRGDVSPTWALNLCQVVTFDRTVWNVLEDRAPMVRNHLGWTVQMERNPNTGMGRWMAGTSIQFNRNVAAKAILDDNGRTLQSAIIVKRWARPRMTLSVLTGVDLTDRKGRLSLLGFGLELEPSPSSSTANFGTTTHHSDMVAERAEYQETTNIRGDRLPPPTKIQINHPSASSSLFR